jgi:predicted nucleic acid-binding protein
VIKHDKISTLSFPPFSKSPLIDRRDKIEDLLKIASEYVRYSERLENRAEEIEKRGFMAMDALHIACAEAAKSDFFITCDDLLLRKGKANKDKLKVRIVGIVTKSLSVESFLETKLSFRWLYLLLAQEVSEKGFN